MPESSPPSSTFPGLTRYTHGGADAGRVSQHLVPVRLETEGGLCGDLVDKFQADVAETADRDWVPS